MLKTKKHIIALAAATFVFCSTNAKVYAVEGAKNNKLKRISGQTRYETSIEISKSGWETSEYVVLTYGQDFPDALCAAPLAKKLGAPIILCDGKNLTQDIKDQLTKLGTKHVYIVGGEGVIHKTIEQELQKLNLECKRLGGKSRYETSVQVAKEVGLENGVVFTPGHSFPDSLSVAPIAAIKGMPILLCSKDSIPQPIEDLIKQSNVAKSYTIGGNGVISDEVQKKLPNNKRISGKNRYSTNVAVIQEFLGDVSFDKVYLSLGKEFPDALCGAAIAGKTGSPLILVGEYDGNETKDFVKSKDIKDESLVLLGGEKVISDTVLEKKEKPVEPKPTPKPIPKPVPKPVPKPTPKPSTNDAGYKKVESLVKPALIYATMRSNVSGFKKGEQVQVLGDSDNGKRYRVVGKNKSGVVSAGNIIINKSPATDKTRLAKQQLELYVNKKGFASSTKYFIWVDINRQMINVFTGSKGKWSHLKSFDCTSGKNVTPTVRGNFQIQDRGGSFYNGIGVGALYWMQFQGNYLFHSILVNTRGQIVDTTLGKRASHGCVRVGMNNIKWMYNSIPRGTSVWIN